jgi:hypothetical protein
MQLICLKPSPAISLGKNGRVLERASRSGALSTQAAPKAETCAMMLAGMGLVGFMVLRRRGGL